MEYIYLTWDEFDNLVEYFQTYLFDNFSLENTVLVSIFRGGVPLGICLSHKLNLPLKIIEFQRLDNNDEEPKIPNEIYDYENIILVDDIIDKGLTIQKVLSKLPNEKIKSIICWIKKKNCNIKDNRIHAFEIDKTKSWIVFPWEK